MTARELLGGHWHDFTARAELHLGLEGQLAFFGEG